MSLQQWVLSLVRCNLLLPAQAPLTSMVLLSDVNAMNVGSTTMIALAKTRNGRTVSSNIVHVLVSWAASSCCERRPNVCCGRRDHDFVIFFDYVTLPRDCGVKRCCWDWPDAIRIQWRLWTVNWSVVMLRYDFWLDFKNAKVLRRAVGNGCVHFNRFQNGCHVKGKFSQQRISHCNRGLLAAAGHAVPVITVLASAPMKHIAYFTVYFTRCCIFTTLICITFCCTILRLCLLIYITAIISPIAWIARFTLNKLLNLCVAWRLARFLCPGCLLFIYCVVFYFRIRQSIASLRKLDAFHPLVLEAKGDCPVTADISRRQTNRVTSS